MPSSDHNVTLRPPRAEDGQALHGLIAACPPLDCNSVYAYHLMARHFAATSVVAEQHDQIIGAITGYRLPDDPTVLFVWQVAVAEAGRGQGLGTRMLTDLIARCSGVSHMHTTIGPDNAASRRSFEKLAGQLGAPWSYHPFLTAAECGVGHEAEDLLVIGPIDH
ncbi:MAG: diaminobutyrate acetyltransferase [Planctomycetota bacterium]|jgi:diaminobutyrate acetyltransferase|nr:diaminobutyrate acetyltransferase [Planctomycetota bacterium]